MTNIEQILKSFDEKFKDDKDVFYIGSTYLSEPVVCKIKSFLQTELSALLEGLVKEIEGEKYDEHLAKNDSGCRGFNQALSLAVDKIKKLIK